MNGKMIIAGLETENKWYQIHNTEYEYRLCKKQNDVYSVLKEELYRELGVFLSIDEKSDVVGFAQYRRYFSNCIEDNKIEDYLNDKTSKSYGLCETSCEELMQGADIVIPKSSSIKSQARSVKNYFEKFDSKHDTKHFEVFDSVFRAQCAQLVHEYEKYMKSSEIILHNMLIMKRDLFEEYKQILKSVLDELDQRLDMRFVSYEQTKEYSMFATVVLAAFCQYKQNQGMVVKEVPVVEFQEIDIEEEWMPAFEHNNIAMVLSSSNFYTIYLSAMLESIIENASDSNNYDITILESGITSDNKNALQLLTEGHDNVSIRFYNVAEKMKNVHLVATGHVSVETYYRLLIPEIFVNYEKVLFLDSDMTVHADVAELFNMSVDGYMVAAAHDQCCLAFLNGNDKSFAKYCKETLKLKNVYDYFQAGVMLLNLTRFREKYTTEQIFEIATSHQFRYVDQDIMNVLCEGEVKHLDLEWDCFPDFGDYEYEFMPYYLQKQYMKARENPKICHHTGPNKPWAELFSDTMMTEHFWRRARKSPLYEQILFRTMMTAAGSYYSGEILDKKMYNRGKTKVKYGIVVPLANYLFPRGTKRRKRAIRFYYGLRRKEIPMWEMDD